MAIGDQATAAGYPLVPDTGEEGRVRYGAREINRSRDFIALVKALIPTTKGAYRTASGVQAGRINTSISNTTVKNGNIIFPTDFAFIPTVQLTVNSGGVELCIVVVSITVNAIGYRVFTKNATAVTANFSIEWLAIGD